MARTNPNIALSVQPIDVIGPYRALQENRRANRLAQLEEQRFAQDEERQARVRNALSQLAAPDVPEQQRQATTLQLYGDDPRVAAGVSAEMMRTQETQRAASTEEAKRHYLEAEYILRDPQNAVAIYRQQNPDEYAQLAQQAGRDLTADEVVNLAQQARAHYGPLAGIEPPSAADTGPLVPFIDPRTGQPVYGTRAQAIGQRPYDKPPSVVVGQYRPLSPEEVAAAGLPPGTSAQLDTTTGKIDVLSKRDTTGGLSQKDQTTARLKLNTVQLARQQLNNIRQRFEAIKGTLSAGPFGQGKVPSKAGRAFDRAVDQMRSTLTSLTRVPGVGAMSDYETRLDQAKFPTRNEYEAVTEQQINDLDDMLNAIERGYQDLLAGVTPGATAPAAPQAPPARTNSDAALSAPPPTNARGWRLMVDAQGNRAYVSPDGTQFEEVQ